MTKESIFIPFIHVLHQLGIHLAFEESTQTSRMKSGGIFKPTTFVRWFLFNRLFPGMFVQVPMIQNQKGKEIQAVAFCE